MFQGLSGERGDEEEDKKPGSGLLGRWMPMRGRLK
jgi:hypothetical protein